MEDKPKLAIENEDGTATNLEDIPCFDEPCMKCGGAPPERGPRTYFFIERDGRTVGVFIHDDCMEADARPLQ